MHPKLLVSCLVPDMPSHHAPLHAWQCSSSLDAEDGRMTTLPFHSEWQILRLASKDEGRIRGAEAGEGARTLHGACNDTQEPPPGERASQSSKSRASSRRKSLKEVLMFLLARGKSARNCRGYRQTKLVCS